VPLPDAWIVSVGKGIPRHERSKHFEATFGEVELTSARKRVLDRISGTSSSSEALGGSTRLGQRGLCSADRSHLVNVTTATPGVHEEAPPRARTRTLGTYQEGAKRARDKMAGQVTATLLATVVTTTDTKAAMKRFKKAWGFFSGFQRGGALPHLPSMAVMDQVMPMTLCDTLANKFVYDVSSSDTVARGLQILVGKSSHKPECVGTITNLYRLGLSSALRLDCAALIAYITSELEARRLKVLGIQARVSYLAFDFFAIRLAAASMSERDMAMNVILNDLGLQAYAATVEDSDVLEICPRHPSLPPARAYPYCAASLTKKVFTSPHYGMQRLLQESPTFHERLPSPSPRKVDMFAWADASRALTTLRMWIVDVPDEDHPSLFHPSWVSRLERVLDMLAKEEALPMFLPEFVHCMVNEVLPCTYRGGKGACVELGRCFFVADHHAMSIVMSKVGGPAQHRDSFSNSCSTDWPLIYCQGNSSFYVADKLAEFMRVQSCVAASLSLRQSELEVFVGADNQKRRALIPTDKQV
jgi:hypothetical protein